MADVRRYRSIVVAVAILALSLSAHAGDSPHELLAYAWPVNPYAPLSDLGRGIGIVFSPDLSVAGNCGFYESHGFACFDDADWSRVLDGLRTNNILYPERRIRTLILETHGTNGNGLKLQKSHDPKADRSYVSVGALQQRLEADGVHYIVISACNSSRLLRPMIYRTLDPSPGDKLFLPATCGIIDASVDWNPRRSHITILTPSESHIETTLAASVRELAPVTRKLLSRSAKSRGIKPPSQFAVSDMLMKMMLRDARLELQKGSPVDGLSSDVQPATVSEGLFDSFIAYLNSVAAHETPSIDRSTTARTRRSGAKPGGR